MTREDIIKYWIKSSDKDYRAMNSLFEHGHYVWALFVGHLVIEKLLKAFYVKQVRINVPYIHDLTKIGILSKMELREDQMDFLDELTTFNIKARYPDFKKRFEKKTTKQFTAKYIKEIKRFRTWLKKQVMSV